MKSLISKPMILLAMAIALLSFTHKPGGEGFEIYLGSKLVIQQYGNEMNTVKNLQIANTWNDDQLTVKYHHCGKVGKNRNLTVKDRQNNVLKEFRFKDTPTPVSSMNIPLKDILSLLKGKGANLNLYYSSSELPNGRMLVSLHN